MTNYEKLLKNKEMLLDIISSSEWVNECQICEYFSAVCGSYNSGEKCKKGINTYYDNHDELFSKEVLTIDILAELIYQGDFRKMFCEKDEQNYDCFCSKKDCIDEIRRKLQKEIW